MSMGIPCSKCQGVGEILEFPCSTCDGDGVNKNPKLLQEVFVDIPRGIKSSMELRLPGHGHAGMRGGKRGHLFVTVKVKPHQFFRHIDDDVHVDIKISLGEMLLGGVKKVPTLDGPIELILPGNGALVHSPSKIMRGRGPPKMHRGSTGAANGNLVVHFQLQLPKVLSPKQIEIIKQFELATKEEEEDSSANPSEEDSESYDVRSSERSSM